MKKFHFSLEVLLEMRKRREDGVKRELATARLAVRRTQDELSRLTGSLTSLQETEKKSRSSALSIMVLRSAVAYRHQIKLDILAKARDIDRLRSDAEKVRLRLVKATQQKKALELLRERRFGEWRKKAHSAERIFIDDISQTGFIRKQRSGEQKREFVSS